EDVKPSPCCWRTPYSNGHRRGLWQSVVYGIERNNPDLKLRLIVTSSNFSPWRGPIPHGEWG
ncbi:hypothetical protein, partial [Candidatus Synechococcus spongiarum]